MFLNRDTLSRLLLKNTELTLKEALEELNIPLGLTDAGLNPEDLIVAGHRLYHGGLGIGALAANFSETVLFNNSPTQAGGPLGLLIVEGLIMTQANGQLMMYSSIANLPTAFLPEPRDTQFSKIATTASGFGVLRGGQNAAAQGTFVSAQTWPLGVFIPWTTVLASQTGLGFVGNVVNIAVGAIFMWRELDLRAR